MNGKKVNFTKFFIEKNGQDIHPKSKTVQFSAVCKAKAEWPSLQVPCFLEALGGIFTRSLKKPVARCDVDLPAAPQSKYNRFCPCQVHCRSPKSPRIVSYFKFKVRTKHIYLSNWKFSALLSASAYFGLVILAP